MSLAGEEQKVVGILTSRQNTCMRTHTHKHIKITQMTWFS